MILREQWGADRVPKTAIACPNVREADALSEILKEELGADDVLKIHYKEEERGVLEDFRRRKSGVLVSVNMINIGFNDRNLEALVIARPIKNPLSYVQLVGRVLRTPSKDGEEWNIKSQLGRAVVVDLTRSLYRLSKDGKLSSLLRNRKESVRDVEGIKEVGGRKRI